MLLLLLLLLLLHAASSEPHTTTTQRAAHSNRKAAAPPRTSSLGTSCANVGRSLRFSCQHSCMICHSSGGQAQPLPGRGGRMPWPSTSMTICGVDMPAYGSSRVAISQRTWCGEGGGVVCCGRKVEEWSGVRGKQSRGVSE